MDTDALPGDEHCAGLDPKTDITKDGDMPPGQYPDNMKCAVHSPCRGAYLRDARQSRVDYNRAVIATLENRMNYKLTDEEKQAMLAEDGGPSINPKALVDDWTQVEASIRELAGEFKVKRS